MKRRIPKFLLTIVMFIILTLLIQPVMTVSADTGTDQQNKYLEEIYSKDSKYESYNIDVIHDDFDDSGSEEFFYIFTKKGTKPDEFNGITADIWFGGKTGVKHILNWSDIQQDSYGRITLGGKKYFRYDLSYATAINTVLYNVKNDKCKKEFSGYYIQPVKNSDDFLVTHSTYDMVYDKADNITVGHTWKPYYYYADAKGIHEYGAKKISEKEFLKYDNAKQIIKKINSQYSKDGKVKLGYLKRSNGLIHINISCETKDSIYYYYKTYQISKKNELTYLASDDESGNYLTALVKEYAVY